MARTLRLRTTAFALGSLLAYFALAASSEAQTPAITNLSPGFGTVGTAVTIYGTDFGTTTGTVNFDGTSATVATGGWTSTSIKVTVPSGAATGAVTVTPSGGSPVSSPVYFDVLATDAALVLGYSPPLSSSCSELPGYDCITEYQNNVLSNIDGIALVTQWSSIESSNSMGTGSGGYTWTSMDNAIKTYLGQTNWNANEMKVGIILSPVTDGGVNTSTPSYVFSSSWATAEGASAPLDECSCSGYSGDSGAPSNSCWTSSSNSDTSGFPAVFEKPFYAALQNFYNAAVSHLNSVSYSSSVAYIRMGVSGGGEAFPFCASSLEGLSSVSPHTAAQLESVWTSYANSMYTYEAGRGSLSPIMAAPSGPLNGTIVTDAWADTEASDAIAEGLDLGSEGFQFQDTITTPCSNDWCATFVYTPIPPIRQLQLIDPSIPSQNVCTGGSGYTVGSLVCLLPFAEGKANSLELFPQDLFIAYDSHDSNYTTYGSAYASAITHLRAGD